MTRRQPINMAKVREGDRLLDQADALGGARPMSEADLSDALSETEDFDARTYYLGKLCPQGHRWHGAAVSLRVRGRRHCVVCEKERPSRRNQQRRDSARRRAQQQAPAPQTPATPVGRPKGRTVSATLAIRLEDDLLTAIDAYADRMRQEYGWTGSARSHAIRRLLRKGLDAKDARHAAP